MPWRKFSNRPNMNIYKEMLSETIKINKDADLTIMSMIIRTELFKHDFTKRQTNIIAFIFTLSFAYGKESAYIPNYNTYFEITGVSHKKIKHELDKLMKMNVIRWNKEENLFTINDPEMWNAPYNQGYDENHLRRLFLLNLEHFGIDVTHLIEKLNIKKAD